MHPAFSVIFFTTASGAGYGLLLWLALGYLAGFIPASTLFLLLSSSTALALVTLGLVSSTFHLGHPERAWRALSQWRSSWLSREGVLAIVCYVPILLFMLLIFLEQGEQGMLNSLALAIAILCPLTVYTTSMIYASLRTIRAWNNHWVPPVYISLALMSGAIVLNALLHLFSPADKPVSIVGLICIVLAFLLKKTYWYSLDNSNSASTAGTATGLDYLGKVQSVQDPHTRENYLMKEMAYQLARKHALKLRRISQVTAFIIPFLLTLVAMFVSGLLATLATCISVLSCALGLLIERWLFFAEARHVVTLYYGAEAA